MTEKPFPATEYFLAVRAWPDRAIIRDDWIRQVIGQPIRVTVQADGAFFDRSYKP